MSRRSLVVGIDGGSAKSTALVADDLGTILAQRQGGNINLLTTSIEAASRSIFPLIAKSCEDVRSNLEEISKIVIGLSGLVRDTEKTRLIGAVNALATKAGIKDLPITVETDARIGLEGAFEGGPGVLMLVGTGTAVIGKTPRGEIVATGGWGHILGDEGSGYFIGREALMTVALEADHLGNSGTLKEVFASKFQLDSRERILAAVYQDKLDLSTLAPAVLEAAERNDIVSQRIVQRAATLLADRTRVVVMRMGILRKVGMVMTGSLLEEQPVYARVLQMKTMKLLPQVELRQPKQPPVRGAVLMALEELKKP